MCITFTSALHPPSSMLSSAHSVTEMSPSPTSSVSLTPSPRFSGVNPISIPLKSLPSPPRTTSSRFSLSPASPTSSTCKPSASCAFPSWPNRDVLFCPQNAFPTSPYNGASGPMSSYISDDDLLNLAELDLVENQRVLPPATVEIPWEATRQPPVVVQAASIRRGPSTGKRRRSSPRKQSRPVREMSIIVEGPE